jgi:hypothetical protein
MSARCAHLLLLLALAAASGSARAEPVVRGRSLSGTHQMFQLEAYGSMLSDLQDRSVFAQTFGWSVRFGQRLGRWAVSGVFGHTLWVGQELRRGVDLGVFNLGVGGERLFYSGRVRVGLTAGACLLGFNTRFDRAGQLGVFAEARPLGYRWRLGERLVLALDPIAFTVEAPGLGDPKLVYHQYRTVLSLEVQ